MWIVGLLAGVATLFLTVGGVRYLMAGGDPAEVERAKSALKSAALGYALAVLAPVLLQVSTREVFAFLAVQRAPRRGENVLSLEDGEPGLSARTIRRRLSSVSGLYAYLVACGHVRANPVPRGTLARGSASRSGRGRPLIRVPRTLPRVLDPAEVDALLAAVRTWRDRAMLEAMLLGGLRRCEVHPVGVGLGTFPGQVLTQGGEEPGRDRHDPLMPALALGDEQLPGARVHVIHPQPEFVVLKRPRRGAPITAAGVDEILDGACRRAGLRSLTCHQLRHTCLTRLRQAGMALEAVQAQAGHRSIESTRIYLHLSNGWLAEEYLRACAAIDADLTQLSPEAESLAVLAATVPPSGGRGGV